MRKQRKKAEAKATRGGKRAGAIVENLATWPGLAVVVDLNKEIASLTAGLRSRFNPMDELDPQDPEVIDDAGGIADALVVPAENKDGFRDEAARRCAEAAILYWLTEPEFRAEGKEINQ